MDPSLQHHVLVPDNFFEFICHVGCYFNMHSIIVLGLIAGGKKFGRDRQTVFFTAVDPMNTHCFEQKELDLTKPRLAAHKANVEDTSSCSVLGRCWACSKNGIEVLPNKVRRDHPLRHSSADLH